MTKYETLALCKPDLPEDTLQAMIKRLSDQIEANQGKLAMVDMWGNRRLGYPVRYRGAKYPRGFYILLTYLGGGQTVAEVERTIRMLEDIMRYQTVKVEDGVDPASITEVMHTRQKDDLFTPEPVFGAQEEEGEEERPMAAAGPEAAGPEAAGPEAAGPEPASPEPASPEPASPEAVSPEAASPEPAGPAEVGAEGAAPAPAVPVDQAEEKEDKP